MKVWQHFYELKIKPSKVLKAQNSYAILCFGIKTAKEITLRYCDQEGLI
jgi:hypothetical protein